MKNLLSEKLLLDTKHGSNCTLEVCTAGEPDNDVLLMKGTCGDCLRKIASHELAFTGDQYFCLYTNQGSYDGINLDQIAWRMGYAPDALNEILGLGDEEALAPEEPKPICLISLGHCADEDYGNTIVQYQLNDLTSFAFSKVLLKDALEDPQKVILDLQETLKFQDMRPLWSDLSQDLLSVILENPFDMYFIEYDDGEWTEEKSETLWDEICEVGVNGSVTCLEDGALVTVYAGAMGSVDWTGHPLYGKPYFENVFENNMLTTNKKPALGDLIQQAEATVAKQQATQSQERNRVTREF